MKRTWGIIKRGAIYWVDLRFNGARIRRSTKEHDIERAVAFRDRLINENNHLSELRAKMVASNSIQASILNGDPEWGDRYKSLIDSGELKKRYMRIKSNAKKREIDFELSADEYCDLVFRGIRKNWWVYGFDEPVIQFQSPEVSVGSGASSMRSRTHSAPPKRLSLSR